MAVPRGESGGLRVDGGEGLAESIGVLFELVGVGLAHLVQVADSAQMCPCLCELLLGGA